MVEAYKTDKTCPNSHCRKHDSTKFSTCRWCGTPYSLTNLPSSYDARENSIWEQMASNPVRTIMVGIAILTVPASIYLYSEMGGSAHHASSYRRRGSIPSLPGAFIYFFSKRTVNDAQNTIKTTNGNDYDSLVKRADAHWTMMNVKEAFDDYTAAIVLKPDIPDTYDKRALIYDAMSAHSLADKDRETANNLRHR